jgi:hypothetical protein
MTVINCDMGEGFGLYKMGDDAAIMPYISVANVACGFHASDFNHMRTTVRLAKQHGVNVGAHPSLPDLQGFGRREMKIARDELANCIIYQVGALKGFLEAEGMPLNHIKPHGSLYAAGGCLSSCPALSLLVRAPTHPTLSMPATPTDRSRCRAAPSRSCCIATRFRAAVTSCSAPSSPPIRT